MGTLGARRTGVVATSYQTTGGSHVVSAFDVELVRSRLDASVNELTHLLYRSAYSTLMRESRDCSFLFMTPDGDVIVNGASLNHQATYYYFIRALRARFADVTPGDIFFTNHPYEAGIPHTNDLAVAIPAFDGDRLVGFSCSIAHKSDVGGSVVGSASMSATHLFQEGLLLPPLRAGRDGELNPIVEEIIAANVRNPELFFGDMRAQLGVTKLGAARLCEVARQIGSDTLIDIYAELLDQGDRLLRQHLASWPDGESTAVGYLDSDGTPGGGPVKLALTVRVAGDEITFDLSAAADQTPGPVNLTAPYTDTSIFYALVALTDPAAGFSDGMRRPVRIVRRPGSVLDPRFPAPVGAAQSMKQRFTDLCFEALCHFVPDRSVAHSGGSGGTLGISWGLADGTRTLQYEVFGSGMGAMHGRDGTSGVGVYTSNLAITPIEVIESMFPVRVRRFELAADSGGPGEWRGGLSYRREYEALASATVRRRAERGVFPASGVDGGSPGRLARVEIVDAGGTANQVPVAGQYELEPGESIRIQGAGGGGFGDPLARDPKAVLGDVEAGLVTRERAREDYGVVVRDGEVDAEATRAERAHAREHREAQPDEDRVS